MEEQAQQLHDREARRGFFEALMDIRFDSLITPKLITFLYVASMAILAIGALLTIVAGFTSSVGTGVLLIVVAPLGALLYLIVVRLWLELIIVAFKIREATEDIARNTARSGG